MPSQTFAASSRTAASPDKAWLALQKPQTWEAISGVDEVFDAEHDATGQLTRFRFRSTAAGHQFAGRAVPGPGEPGRSVRWDITTSALEGWVRVDLEPDDQQSMVEVSMQVGSASLMGSFAFPLIASSISNGLQQTVDDFAARLDD